MVNADIRHALTCDGICMTVEFAWAMNKDNWKKYNYQYREKS